MLKAIEFKLPKEVFGKKPNLNLLAQAVHVYEETSHTGFRKAKTRSEVNRTTKKLYKQKGTGGARHGSRRAPIFVGGGVALGPRPIKRILSLPKALRDLSRVYAFSSKADAKEIVTVDGLSKVVKTAEIATFLKKYSDSTNSRRSTFVVSEKARPALRNFKNLKNVRTVSFKDANALDILNGGTIFIDADIFEKPKQKAK